MTSLQALTSDRLLAWLLAPNNDPIPILTRCSIINNYSLKSKNLFKPFSTDLPIAELSLEILHSQGRKGSSVDIYSIKIHAKKFTSKLINISCTIKFETIKYKFYFEQVTNLTDITKNAEVVSFSWNDASNPSLP